jgi:methylated-DNA-protein-cysteine methyltransferase-like protein
MSPFEKKILEIVRTIPRGRVMSYGQLALYAGSPSHAREAGNAMRTLGNEPDFPWWRVLNSAGKITIAGNPDASAELQQKLLKEEGVEFSVPFRLDMERYLYRAEESELKKLGLDDWIIKSALYKYGKTSATQQLGL